MNSLRFDMANLLCGLLLIATGIFFALESLDLELGTALRMGPGYFPRVLGGVLIFLGILTAIRGLTTQGVPFGGWPWRYFILILGSVTLFALILPKLGLALSSFILVALSGFAAPEGKTWQIIAYAAALSLTASCVFVYLLGLEIPLWPWSP